MECFKEEAYTQLKKWLDVGYYYLTLVKKEKQDKVNVNRMKKIF